MQEFPLDEVVDDRRSRRLRADAVDVLELLLGLRILDVLVDFLHASKKRRGRETGGRLCHRLLELALRILDVVAFFHDGQRIILVFAALVAFALVAVFFVCAARFRCFLL